MKHIYYLSFALLLLVSCDNDNKPVKPENLISKEKMAQVLMDLSIVSSAKGVNKKILEKNGINPEQYVYQKHDIDSLQFLQSNTYYAYSPKEYREILNQVQQNLTTSKEKYNKIVKKEAKEKEIRDSVIRKRRKDSFNLKKKAKIKKKRTAKK